MEIRLLRYFLAVAETLHFGRAAERLHISQPPLSQQIMKLEEDVGVKLFERTRRSVQLTPAGKALEIDARKIMASVAEARANAVAAAKGQIGTLSLGYVGPAMDGVLPDLIREFKLRYPDVHVKLRHLATRDQLTQVEAGTLNAGVVRLHGQDTAELAKRRFHTETYVLALPSGHRLNRRRTVALAELAGEPMIFFPRQTQPGLYDEWISRFAAEGFIPRIVQEATDKHACVALVAAGMGVSIVPESTARLKRDGVVFRKLRGDIPGLILHLVHKTGRIFPVLENFLSLIFRDTE